MIIISSVADVYALAGKGCHLPLTWDFSHQGQDGFFTMSGDPLPRHFDADGHPDGWVWDGKDEVFN